MSMERRALIIQAQLEAISRGRSPTAEQVAVWIKELEGIDLADLEERIKQARRDHSEKLARGNGWGHITPDDVLTVHRRVRSAEQRTTGGPPSNPDCSYRCLEGQVSVFDPDGYETCVRCYCFAGDWWKKHPVFGAGHDVAELIQRGWRPVRESQTLPDDHVEWLRKRASQVGFGRAISEYRNHQKGPQM